MGSSSYDSDTYAARSAFHKSTGTDMFTHDADIKSGKVKASVHEKLDPSKLNAAGKNIRESFDSKEHPNSRPIAVIFDVTGSMSSVPKIFVEKLDKLMAATVKKGYVQDPHVLFGAVGDATCDCSPLQIGQFEAGNEMDEVLTLIHCEGGGGGHVTESYELAMYFMSRHTDLDSFNKRGEKGYLFLSGDEIPYSEINKEQVKNIIGDSLQENIPTKNILEELREKFEVFWILPKGTSNYNNPRVTEPLKEMFGQNLLRLENPADICELIVSTIGINEGYDIKDIAADLKDIGSSADSIAGASKALAAYTPSALVKGAKITGKIPKSSKTDAVERV